MKIHRTLTISSKDSNSDLDATLRAAVSDPWTVDVPSASEHSDPLFTNRYLIFSKKSTPDLPGAKIFLLPTDEGNLELQNVMPIAQAAWLSMAQYNQIVESFVSSIGRLDSGNASPLQILTTDELDVESLVGPECFQLMLEFDGMANRTALHPSDCNMLYRISSIVARSSIQLPSDTFRQWLQLERNWSSDNSSIAVKHFDIATRAIKVLLSDLAINPGS